MYVAAGGALTDGIFNCSLGSSGCAERPPPSVFERLPAAEVELPSDENSEDRSRERGDGIQLYSVGRCVSEAVESASKRLSCCCAAAEQVSAKNTDQSAATPDGLDPGGSTRSSGHNGTNDESERIPNLLWSPEACTRLDSVVRLMTKTLHALDDEVSRDREASVGAGAGEGAGVAEERYAIRAGDVPEGSTAGRLLARVLSLSLGKQDVEEDGGGSEGGQAAAGPLLRELYEKLGALSNAHEKLDAVNTLLLAGWSFKGVNNSSGGSRG